MNRWMTFIAAVVVSMSVAMSCSGGGGNIVTPASDTGITPGVSKNTGQSQTHLWGYYDVYIDWVNETVEAVPNRDVMFTANVTDFVNSDPANLSFFINGTPLWTGCPGDAIDVDIDVSIEHPFPGMNMYDGYDVRGVFIGDQSATLLYDGDLKYGVECTDQVMLDCWKCPEEPCEDDCQQISGSPDGYTRWFNPPEFPNAGLFGYTPGVVATSGYEGDATLCPYKYFADGLNKDDNLWTFLTTTTNNGVFTAGSTNTRNYYLRFPMPDPGVKFNYAILANWEAEDVHPSNAIEAVGCEIEVTDNLWYESSGSWGGNLIADIDLFGWQHEPSTVQIESTVLNTVHTVSKTTWTTIGEGNHFVLQMHINIPADIVHDAGCVEEIWVIAEYEDSDYKNDFGESNQVDDCLTAFFRFCLDVLPESPCTSPESVEGMSLTCLYLGSKVTGITITGGGFEDIPELSARLDNGVNSVAFSNLTFVSATELNADLDLGLLPGGTYDVVVSHGPGCDATAEDFFTVDDTTYASGNWSDAGYDSTYDIRDNPSAIVVPLGDDSDSGPIDIGFDYDYYGFTYSQFIIGSNGYIVLQNSGDGKTADEIPDGCGCWAGIAPFAEDVNPNSGGTVSYLVQGTSPNRTLTIQYDGVPFYSDTYLHTFSATLFEGTNLLRHQYEDVLPEGGDGTYRAVAYCSFRETGLTSEADFLFCAVDEWPDVCPNLRAFEADLPEAQAAQPSPCTYISTPATYDSNYECSGTAQTLTLGDDNSSDFVDIGFTFTYAGGDYTQVTVNDNAKVFLGCAGCPWGTIYCGDWYIDWVGGPSETIQATSDDLDTDAGGLVKYETRTIGSDEVFIVEWENVPTWGATGSSNTFQIVLFNNPGDTCDDILMQYHSLYDTSNDAYIWYNANQGGFEIELCLNDGSINPLPVGGGYLIQ